MEQGGYFPWPERTGVAHTALFKVVQGELNPCMNIVRELEKIKYPKPGLPGKFLQTTFPELVGASS